MYQRKKDSKPWSVHHHVKTWLAVIHIRDNKPHAAGSWTYRVPQRGDLMAMISPCSPNHELGE